MAAAPPPSPPTSLPPLAVIVPTHTTRHLRRTLLGVACQTRRADWVVVSCDNDSEEIRAVVEASAAEFSLPVTLVQRPFAGRSRSGQVRNNAVRALTAGREAPPRTRLVFLDGDCCPAPDALELHQRLARERGGDLVIGFRVDLTPEQTEAFSEDALREHRTPVEVTPEQMANRRRRHRRYQRHLSLRRMGLAKAHKPKLLSANFSIGLGSFSAINGFDETYEGYGQEDDDLGRRFYAAARSGSLPAGTQPRAVIGIADILVLHLYHPTRAPGMWHDSPNAAALLRSAPARCAQGLENPLPQDPCVVVAYGAPARTSAAEPAPVAPPG